MGLVLPMEASMHGSFNGRSENQDRAGRNWNIGLFALPALFVITLVALAIAQPSASNWISEAVQAEFGPPVAAPTQLAKSATQIRTVKAY
jgi:hypothetical protein